MGGGRRHGRPRGRRPREPDRGRGAPADRHAILRGVDLAGLVGNGSLYKVSPLQAGTTPLLIGTITGSAPEPVAWTHTYGPRNARVFFTSFGHVDDFAEPAFRRLLHNAVFWGLDRAPTEPRPTPAP